VQAAKRSSLGRGTGPDVGDWLEWMFDPDEAAPGALRNAVAIVVDKDSILALQYGGQLNIYSRTGRMLSIVGMDNGAGRLFMEHTSMSRARDGWLSLALRSTSAASRAGGGAVGQTYTLRRASVINGALGEPFVSIPIPQPARIPSRVGQLRPLVAPVPVVRLAGGRLVHVSADSFAVDMYDDYGRFTRAIRIQSERVRVTRQYLEQAVESQAASYRRRAAQGDSSAQRWLDEAIPVLMDAKYPQYLPIAGNAWLAPDGSIAVSRLDLTSAGQSAADSVVLDLIGTDGRYRGRVAFPRSFGRVLHFTGDALYVAQRAGVLAPAGAGTPMVQEARDRSGNVVREAIPSPEVAYERLLRMEIGG
jgi:hypothetical protein